MVNYTYHNTPFYRKGLQELNLFFDDIHYIDDIIKLQFANKYNLRGHYSVGFAVKITDVIGFSCPNASGALALVMKSLLENGEFIKYIYSFDNGNTPNIVIRPTDLSTCEKILEEKKVGLIAASDLYRL